MVETLASPRRNGETAILCLDRAVHPGTDDVEVMASIQAFRRITNGSTLSVICEQVYGSADYLVILEDEWEEKFAKQTDEITALKLAERRLRRELDAALAKLE